jgi:hypothetical protein
MTSAPKIVALDDDETSVKPLIPSGCEFITVSPSDVTDHQEDFEQASLILVDHELYKEEQPLSLMAQDGAGFVAQLRSWARRRKTTLPPIVILTSLPSAFETQIPAVGPAIEVGDFRGHEARLAPALDVEWLLFKADDNVSDQIDALAKSYSRIATLVGTDGTSLAEVPDVLRMPTSITWKSRADEDIRRSRPPISQQEQGRKITNDGPTEFIRWLCHRALSYPGLFVSDLHAEWALGLKKGSMATLFEVDPVSSLQQLIRSSLYTGPLDKLFPRRWWRAGIDEATTLLGEAVRAEGSEAALKAFAPNASLELGETTAPSVVVWNDQLVESDIVPVGNAIQIQPPGWPIEAMAPWMEREVVKSDPRLRAMIDPLDDQL